MNEKLIFDLVNQFIKDNNINTHQMIEQAIKFVEDIKKNPDDKKNIYCISSFLYDLIIFINKDTTKISKQEAINYKKSINDIANVINKYFNDAVNKCDNIVNSFREYEDMSKEELIAILRNRK